jgi:uncharacterized membrane protein (UPF0182 family)
MMTKLEELKAAAFAKAADNYAAWEAALEAAYATYDAAEAAKAADNYATYDAAEAAKAADNYAALEAALEAAYATYDAAKISAWATYREELKKLEENSDD